VSGTGITAQTITITQQGTSPSLSLSGNTLSLNPSINSNGTISITSNTSWTASSNQTWLTVSPTSGSNNGTLTLTASSANTATTARTATVTVSGTGVTAQTITVTQQGVDSYTISITSNPTTGGTTSGGGTFASGTGRTVTATPATGHNFLYWSENGNQVSTNASYTLTLNSNMNLVANFTPTPCIEYSSFYSETNTNPQIRKEGYLYHNGIHYLVWSNGFYNSGVSPTSTVYDGKIKLSTSKDGIKWNTEDILSTQYGSVNHVIAIDNDNKIHIVFNEGTQIGYYGLVKSNLVYANNSKGIWEKNVSNLGTGNGFDYNYSVPYSLVIGDDKILRLYYCNTGWWGLSAPLLFRTYQNEQWSSPKTISNLINGGNDSQNNILSFIKKTNGKIRLYISDGWQCSGVGCIPTFNNNIRILEEGDNFTYSQIGIISNCRWYYENQKGDIIKLLSDGQTLMFNDKTITKLSGKGGFFTNIWIDETGQYIVENVGEIPKIFSTTGQILHELKGGYIVPGFGLCIIINSTDNPKTVNLFKSKNLNLTEQITGQQEVCYGAKEIYSIPQINGAVKYIWELPSSWSGSSVSNQINCTIGQYSGNIKVYAELSCGITNQVSKIVNVNQKPLTPVISLSSSGVELVTSQVNGIQWYNNNTIIPNQTNTTYRPLTSGEYYVKIFDNVCYSEKSNSINYVYSNTLINKNQTIMSIFPNPVNNIFTINSNIDSKSVSIIIFDSRGKKIKQLELLEVNKNWSENIEMADYASGVYFVKIITDKRSFEYKIIKR
jgi:hypothetical protein